MMLWRSRVRGFNSPPKVPVNSPHLTFCCEYIFGKLEEVGVAHVEPGLGSILAPSLPPCRSALKAEPPAR